MSKHYRSLLVVDTDRPQKQDPCNRYTYRGDTYTEDDLRDWAMEVFSTSGEATLEDIARDIEAGGWLLYEGIWPSVSETEKSTIGRVAEVFQGKLEICADEIADELRGAAPHISAKTQIAEVRDNQVVITITVTPTTEVPKEV